MSCECFPVRADVVSPNGSFSRGPRTQLPEREERSAEQSRETRDARDESKREIRPQMSRKLAHELKCYMVESGRPRRHTKAANKAVEQQIDDGDPGAGIKGRS